MKAAVLEAFGSPMKIHQNWADPKCGPEDAIIKVAANGVCRSDCHVCDGDWEWIGLQPELPHVIGHEFCGVVVATVLSATRATKMSVAMLTLQALAAPVVTGNLPRLRVPISTWCPWMSPSTL